MIQIHSLQIFGKQKFRKNIFFIIFAQAKQTAVE